MRTRTSLGASARSSSSSTGILPPTSRSTAARMLPPSSAGQSPTGARRPSGVRAAEQRQPKPRLDFRDRQLHGHLYRELVRRTVEDAAHEEHTLLESHHHG